MGTFTTKTAEFSNIESDIILIRLLENAEIDVPESEENFEATLTISKGKKYAVLVDARVFIQISPEARAYSADKKRQENLIAQAIVVNSLANRLMGSFLIKFNKPPAPTKLFSDTDTALEWLRKEIAKAKQ